MFSIRPQREVRILKANYEEIAGILQGPETTLQTVVSQVSLWSPLQQIDHLIRVNDAVWSNIHRILAHGADTEEDGVQETGRPTRLGLLMLLSTWIPRGKGRAPDSVLPAPTPLPSDVAQALTKSQRELESVSGLAPRLGRQRGRLRHFVFGDLNALEWLRFARIHTHHHLRILRDIRRRQS